MWACGSERLPEHHWLQHSMVLNERLGHNSIATENTMKFTRSSCNPRGVVQGWFAWHTGARGSSGVSNRDGIGSQPNFCHAGDLPLYAVVQGLPGTRRVGSHGGRVEQAKHGHQTNEA